MNGKKVAVIGCGIVGRSFSIVFASGGYDVYIYDTDPNQLANGLEDVRNKQLELERLGCGRGSLSPDEQFKRIHTSTSLQECVEGAIYVQECVFDRLELKRKVFHDLECYVTDDVVLASSTGAIFPSKISEGLEHKSRLLVAHPLNPPHLVPLVEIVPSPWTDQSAIDSARSIMTSVGQVPIVLSKEVPGFVICRVQHAITAECFKLVRDGIVSADDLDKLMPSGLGLRYAFLGPLETSYLNAAGMKDFCERYGQGIFDLQKFSGPPIPLEGEMVDRIQEEIEKRIPLDKIDEKRQWRDERLAALISLKKKLG